MNRPRRRRLWTTRPSLELLEDRTLLSKGLLPAELFLQSVSYRPVDRPAAYLVPPPADFPFVREPDTVGAASFTGLLPFGETEPNDSQGTANPVPLGFDPGEDDAVDVSGFLTGPTLVGPSQDVDDGGWNLNANANIANATTVPHISIQGTGDGTFDYYSFTVGSSGVQAVFDIDSENFDTELFLYSANGTLLNFNDDEPSSDPGSGSGLASRITHTFTAPGTYVIGVGAFNSFDAGGVIAGAAPLAGDVYTLHISLQGHALNPTGNDPVAEVEPNHLVSDRDFFAMELEPGDILGASVSGGGRHLTFYAPDGTELMGSGQDVTFIHPFTSPLPGGGNAALSYVIDTPGTYAIAVDQGTGNYSLNLRVFRPVLENEPAGTTQTIFLDFNGAVVNPAIFGGPSGNRFLSSLTSFLPNWGLAPTFANRDLVIDAIVAEFERSFSADVRTSGNNGDFAATGIPGQFDVRILNSRDHADPWGQPNVSRVIIGGTIAQLGIFTIGIAESIDVGNFDTTETAVVLLDLLSDPTDPFNSLNSIPRAPGVSIIDLIGAGVGNIAAHEAGHFSGAWHTDQFNASPNIMDQGGNLGNTIGLGPDGIFGTADDVDVSFGRDVFVPNEGFTGLEDTLNVLAFGHSTGVFRPPNDAFNRRIVIDPLAPQAAGSNTAATAEVLEPGHAGSPATNSVWWTWTAPATATARITTQGSNFDTRLAVYTGSSLGGLTLVAENNDVDPPPPPTDLTSQVTFSAVQGTVYQIAVDGFNGANGNVRIDIDLAPQDLAVVDNAVDENQPVGTGVGTFQTTDPDITDNFSYTFVTGAGDTDNGLFQIVGSQLRTLATFDHEAQDTYTIRVRTTDRLGLSFERALTININDVNEPITELTLDNTTIPENQPANAIVGKFQVVDPDIGQVYTYTLIPGPGSNDNASFKISGDTLQTVAPFNFESKDLFRIRVRVSDVGGSTVEEPFLVRVTDVPEAPANLTLSNNRLDETTEAVPLPAGTVVGTFQVSDPDRGDTLTLALVGGPGGEDNGRFTLNGNQLVTAEPFDFEAQSAFTILARATDQAGLSIEQAFPITIRNVNEPPADITLTTDAVVENQPPGVVVGDLGAIDPDASESFTFALVAGPGGEDNASFRISGRRLETAGPLDFEARPVVSILVRVTDRGGLSFVKTLNLNVADANEPPLDITLNNNAVLERLPAGSAVGTLGAIDQDPGESFTFSLAVGPGDSGNAFFAIDGNTLRTTGPLDFEALPSLSVRVQATDLGGQSFEKVFSITVVDVSEAQTAGSFDPATGTWYLRTSISAGPADAGNFVFGAAGWKPVLGDWDGDDIDTVGVVDNTGASNPFQAIWYLRNSNSSGPADVEPFAFGLPGWIPVVGDWDGDGIDGIGMVDPQTGTWYLRNTPSSGPVDIGPFTFGMGGWTPVVGDWDGDGIDTIGTVDPTRSLWFQRNVNAPGAPDIFPFAFGGPGWTPVVGDWEGNGTSTVGIVDPAGNWSLHVANTSGFSFVVGLTFGAGDWVPMAGTYSFPFLRALEVGPNPSQPPLDPGALSGLVSAALPHLAAAGIDPATLSRLSAAQVLVADLPGTLLGRAEAAANRIWIDADAAGWGWFVDPTPEEGSEFATGSVAGMDLLSVVAHELGHLAGLDHGDEDSLMGEVLRPGQRRLSTLDAIFRLGL